MIEVHDTYARSQDGRLVHFDVLVNPGTSDADIKKYANQYLESIVKGTDLTLEIARCNYCHSEPGNKEIDDAIEKNGHYILPLEGCPR